MKLIPLDQNQMKMGPKLDEGRHFGFRKEHRYTTYRPKKKREDWGGRLFHG